MKVFLSIAAFLFTFPVLSSTKYYLSSGGSDDSNGTSEKTAWRTIGKLNSEFGKIKPGDMILFKRGETFSGTIKVLRSGTTEKPIVFGAYGVGNAPEITGFSTITDWQDNGNGIFSKTVSFESPFNILTINGVNTPKGRWPDKGSFMTIKSHKENSIISDHELRSAPDFTGGEIVFRPYPWIINYFPILKQTTTEIHYPGKGDMPRDGYGYFIQNHTNTLDQTGEWALNDKILKVFFGKEDPSGFVVKAGSIDFLFRLDGISNIMIENLTLTGANKGAIDLTTVSNIVIRNCRIEFTGRNAIITNYGGSSSNIQIYRNEIRNSNSSFIKVLDQFRNVKISDNLVENTGILIGMGDLSSTGAYTAIMCDAPDITVENNRIINTGYNGIVFTSKARNVLIKNNYINTVCLVADDGGGIYTWIGAKGRGSTGQVIKNNIVLNAVGSAELGDNEMQANGIYLDDGAEGILIEGNTVANSSGTGIFIHNGHEITILNNTVFNCSKAGQISFVQDHHAPEDLIRNIEMRDNVFCANSPDQKVLTYLTTSDDIAQFGKADHNYYINPFINGTLIVTQTYAWRGKMIKRNLQSWQEYTRQDANSKEFPVCKSSIKTILSKGYYKLESGSYDKNKNYNYVDINSATLIINDTGREKSYPVKEPLIDAKGISHFSRISLHPFTSVIVYKLQAGK